MKITQTDIAFDKASTHYDGSVFQMEDISSTFVERGEARPGLLTAILGGEANTEYLTSGTTFVYDEMDHTSQLPSGKPYSGYGEDLQKDHPRQKRFGVPSFGLRSNVAPADYAGRRRPGSMELLTEADVVAAMNTKAEEAWANFDELGFAQLLTTDTNIVRGGPFTSYNFYTDIVGSSRPAKIDMDLGNTSIDHDQAFRVQRRLLTQELVRAKDTTRGIVVLCGDTFFDSRYELQKNEGLARPIRFGLDLASQPINEDDFGSATFNYAWFDGQDGLRYINYGANILAGTKLIDDDDAYMVPLGARNLVRVVYAPAQTRSYVNQQALPMYAYSAVDEKQGVTTWTEKNKLFSLINPRAIRHLTSTTAP